ncbi:MAG TPA: TetR/AcrR family transcriptional regulator [Nitriliruptorales bacterium]
MATTATVIRRLASDTTNLPPDVSPGGTAGALLDSALLLFAEQGFAGASIRDIAAAAGVTSATLYAHYPSKGHILAHVVEIAHTEHHRRLRAALLASDADPANQLTSLVRAHVLMHAEYPMLSVVANAELHAVPPELVARSLDLRGRSEELLNEVIARGIELGRFDPPHAWMAAAAIGGMGIRVAHWFTENFEATAEQVADTYAEFARRLVGAGSHDGGEQ